MIKCLLIYLWIYIGLFYMIEAGDDDEHVHIKLHMPSGQRKRTQHTQQHHKKRHIATAPHHHHRHNRHAPSATVTTNLFNDSPHNFLTATSMPHNHAFHATKKFPSSSLLNMEEEVFGQGDVGGDSLVSVDTNGDEPMVIPSYLTKNFASFPHPTTTYETEVIPHNFAGFNVVNAGGLDGPEDMEEDNEITAPAGRGKGSLESIILSEHMENYQRHKPPSSASSSSSKIIKNEQLLQQLLQQQRNEQPEIMNAANAAYKSAKFRPNKYKTETDYHSEDDMTEGMMYSSAALDTRHNSPQSFNRPKDDVLHGGSIKPLTVDDIWSQLQQQYLSKYSPQAQPLAVSGDSDEQLLPKTPTKIKSKRKRNTKRQRHAKPTTATSAYSSTTWPAKSLSYAGSKHHYRQHHHLQPIKQQHQHYYDDIHSPPSAAAFSSPSSLSSQRDADFFAKRPFSAHNNGEYDDTAELDDEAVGQTSEDDGEDDDFDIYGDESYEESVYQRGKKFTHSTSNPFSSHDLYGSFSTPITATVATNIQPSTYHPHLVSSTLPAFTASTSNAFLPTISYPSTSYQWHTQENYPASYQTYHLQHQQQQPQWTADEQYELQHSATALRLPKATILQTGNAISSSKLTPTESNDYTVSSTSSSSSAAKSTAQPPARYKKRKNRIKPKRNRIVVI